MNSKQRRRLRKQKLPRLIDLLATKRITGELAPWINAGGLVKAATQQPQGIARLISILEDQDE